MELLAERLAQHVLFGEAEDPKSFLKRMSAQKDAEEIKSGRRQAPAPVEPCQEWIEWENLEEWQQTAAQELQDALGAEFGLKSFDTDEFIVSTQDHDWYRVFRNEDAATVAARYYVREMLNEEPDNFTPDWLASFINLNRLRRELHDSARDDDYWNEGHPDIKSKIQELIDRGYLDEDPLIDSDSNAVAVTPKIEQIVDDKWEEMIEAHATAQLVNPIGYLEQFEDHGAALKRAIEMVGIDVDAATESAINTDGWQHFLNSYDGESHDLPSGAVYVRQ
jgi:hypothetical protein